MRPAVLERKVNRTIQVFGNRGNTVRVYLYLSDKTVAFCLKKPGDLDVDVELIPIEL
jgi:hypothetical protein